MKLAIIWICAIAALCGSSKGSVLRDEGIGKRQVVERTTSSESDEANKIADYFEASNEEQQPNVESSSSTTRRPVDPEQLLAEIQKTHPTRSRPVHSSSISIPTPEPMPETTTEYKYKDLVAAHTFAPSKYIPMRHVVGTHYVKVDKGQDEYERIMEDYNRLFNHGSYPTQNDYSTPPKY